MARIDTTNFSHIQRVRDRRFPYDVASILPGEFFVSREPMVIYTVLGSCISACIRDPDVRVGGMNHFMLPMPQQRQTEDSWGGRSTRYGSFAMEQLINGILSLGGAKHRLEIKLFGAGKLYESKIDVGRRNTEWVLRYLHEEGLPIAKQDLGDTFPRKVYYYTDSGRVLIKSIRQIKTHTIFARESDYEHRLKHNRIIQPKNITLF